MLPLPLDMLFAPSLTELGRLPARAPLSPIVPSYAQDAMRLSLDGTWQFALASAPEAAPENWTTADVSGWRVIHVPGVWTRQDTGDLPIYTNVRMPFAYPHEPGAVPEKNPTGLYRTTFAIAPAWAERDVVLHIGGFESVALVWCNGAFVGMGKDSRLPSEFDLTAHLVAGENTLAIMVIKWSDATWIEDQDHWRHGGLHRSVFIEARAKTRIDDLIVVADYDAATGVGDLNVRAQIKGASAGWRVSLRLEDEAGQVLAELAAVDVKQFGHDASVMRQLLTTYSYPGHEAELNTTLPNTKAWSAETPHRYRLLVELRDASDEVTETHASWIGFRRVEVRDRRLLVNDRPIVIIGVNRHDHHPDNGKTPSLEDMRADLVSMKQHNINAVRTSHYPNDHRLLDIADELGLYVIDEANVECHARARAVANDARYQTAILQRVQRMIERDRNHPCIIGWSLGNEAGHGPAHDGAASLARRLDPTRFIHYEGAIMDRFVSFWADATASSQKPPSRSERNTTDLVCPMYPPIDLIVNWARWAEDTKLDDRPLILCEYSHAMGNSNGSIAAYVDAFYAEPALGGGFVWEWRDHGLAETDESGRFYWAYGGHFGEERHDGNFCCDGLVGPDGTPHPGLIEYQWAARPVTAEWVRGNTVRLRNRRIFTATDDLVLGWSLLIEGVRVEGGVLDVSLAPGAETTLEIPFTRTLTQHHAYHLTLKWRLKSDAPWGRSGHRVAWDQLTLFDPPHAAAPDAIAPVSMTSSVGGQLIEAGGLTISLDSQNQIASVSAGGVKIIAGDVTACFWRAPTDNDGVQTLEEVVMSSRWKDWLALGLDQLSMSPVRAQFEGGVLTLEREWQHGNGPKAVHRSRWNFRDDGAQIDEEMIVPEAWNDLPRVGLRFEVPKGFEQLAWFGLGPDESYNDRHGAQTVGHWSSRVEDQYHAFAYPQEHGSHFDTRAFSLRNEAGDGFTIDLPQRASIAARHHHDADLTVAKTLADLVRRDTIEVHIDAALRGMGTGACGPDALPAFRVGAGVHRFSWVLRTAKP